MNLPNFFAELKRRNVYEVAIAYAVVAWLLIQIASQIFPFFDIPSWEVRLVVLLLIIGFPIAASVSRDLFPRARRGTFSRSFLRSAKFLVQNRAILRNTVRMLNRQTPSLGNAVQSSETMRNSLGLN